MVELIGTKLGKKLIGILIMEIKPIMYGLIIMADINGEHIEDLEIIGILHGTLIKDIIILIMVEKFILTKI
jgi:hypothetical protein